MIQPKKGMHVSDVYDQYHGMYKYNRYFYLRLGRIVAINYDRYTMTIEWIQGAGSQETIISFPYIGPAGCIGAMPEVGALGIFGFYNEGTGKGRPFLVNFAPAGLETALNNNTVKVHPDSVDNEDENLYQFRFRKMTKGDVIVSSSLGGEIFLNTDIEIGDESGDLLNIRNYEQSIIATSLNNFVFADGASVSAGPIIRNNLNLIGVDAKRLSTQNWRELSLPNGRDIIYLVPNGGVKNGRVNAERVNSDTSVYTEYRIDVDDLGNLAIDNNNINDYTPNSYRDPIITLAMGNYAGALDTDKSYGKILRPVLFTSKNDQVGDFNLVECDSLNSNDETLSIGLAYALHLLKTGTFIGLDKEGHYYMNLGRSTANRDQAGRSMSTLAAGSLKEIWGGSDDDNNSWDLTAKGGIRWNVGHHNGTEDERSIIINTDSGIYLNVDSDSNDGYAKQETIGGNTLEYVSGDKKDTVQGTLDHEVLGLKTEKIRGTCEQIFDSDYNLNVAGVFTEVIQKEKQSTIGQRKTTISDGDDELEIVKGDLIEKLTFGNRKTTLTAGNLEETLTKGDRKTKILKGNYEVSIVSGDFNIKALAGKISLNSVSPSGGFEVSSLASSAEIKSKKVSLGISPGGGVVVGAGSLPSHYDYITGSPCKGAATVEAGP